MILALLHVRRLQGLFLFVTLVFSGEGLLAQKRTVDSGWQSFAFPEGRTLVQAKQWVIEQAKIKAMANAFGTRVSSETILSTSDFNGQVDEVFSEMNVLQVRGEWNETTSLEGPNPKVEDGEIWWSVRIQGKASPWKETSVPLELNLRGDVLATKPIEFLEDGDRLRARFQSPVDGHVMFFFAEDEEVFALSTQNSDFSEEVRGQQVYSLFSSESEWLEAGAESHGLDRLARYAWKFNVTGDGVKESQAMLIGVFASHVFSPPNMNWDETSGIWSMKEERFEQWIKQNTSRSDRFQVERSSIRIRPKQRY